MEVFQIIDQESNRYYPAKIYSIHDQVNELETYERVAEVLRNDCELFVVANRFNSDADELGYFEGHLKESDIKKIMPTIFYPEDVNLDLVMTLTEAAEKWGLANGSSIRKAIERKKFKTTEIKQCGKVWIITYPAMQRVFGPARNTRADVTIHFIDFQRLVGRIVVEVTARERGFSILLDGEADGLMDELREIINKSVQALERGNKVVVVMSKQSKAVKQIINTKLELYKMMSKFCLKQSTMVEMLKLLNIDLNVE